MRPMIPNRESMVPNTLLTFMVGDLTGEKVVVFMLLKILCHVGENFGLPVAGVDMFHASVSERRFNSPAPA